MTKPQVDILRTFAALPDDDWQPEHWDAFTAAQSRARQEVERDDRKAARRTASRATRRARATERKGPPDIPETTRQIIRDRSGGKCEIQWCADAVGCFLRTGVRW